MDSWNWPSDQTNCTQKLLQHEAGICYDDFDEGVPYDIKLWAQKAIECSQDLLDKEMRLWAQRAVQNPAQVLQPLARGHVIHWFTEIHEDTASRAFKLAWKAFATVRRSRCFKPRIPTNTLSSASLILVLCLRKKTTHGSTRRMMPKTAKMMTTLLKRKTYLLANKN